MRKVLFALVVVSFMGFGLSANGEGATEEVTGCIKAIDLGLHSPGNAWLSIEVGNKFFRLTTQGLTLSGPEVFTPLSYAQVAAFEPVLSTLRAGLAARGRARVMWEVSTKRVKYIRVFLMTPC